MHVDFEFENSFVIEKRHTLKVLKKDTLEDFESDLAKLTCINY